MFLTFQKIIIGGVLRLIIVIRVGMEIIIVNQVLKSFKDMWEQCSRVSAKKDGFGADGFMEERVRTG
jgi:hypothetical protein